MRGDIYERINTVWFNLDEIFEQTEYIYSDTKQISGFLGQELTTKMHSEISGDGAMWCLHFNVFIQTYA